MNPPPTLHYMIYGRYPVSRDDEAILDDAEEWLIENFGKDLRIRRYRHSISVLFNTSDQVFLARLKLHEHMHAV